MSLLGVGKGRFRTLNTAARKRADFCPYDGRFGVREKKAPSHKWDRVHSYLTQLYHECAEPIPDGWNSNKRPRSGPTKLDTPQLDRSKLRHLPYGTIADYWNQCMAVNSDLQISRKLFCSDASPQSNQHFPSVFFLLLGCSRYASYLCA